MRILRFRFRHLVALALLFVATATAGFWLGVRGWSASRGCPLQVDEACLDFGEVVVSDGYSLSVPIKNVSRHEVEIVEARSSCACISIDAPRAAIAPDEGARIQLLLDLTSRGDPSLARQVRRPFTAGLRVLVAGGEKPVVCQWDFGGVVYSPLAFEPPSPEFGGEDLVRGGGPFKPLEVRVVAPDVLRQLSARCENA